MGFASYYKSMDKNCRAGSCTVRSLTWAAAADSDVIKHINIILLTQLLRIMRKIWGFNVLLNREDAVTQA